MTFLVEEGQFSGLLYTKYVHYFISFDPHTILWVMMRPILWMNELTLGRFSNLSKNYPAEHVFTNLFLLFLIFGCAAQLYMILAWPGIETVPSAVKKQSPPDHQGVPSLIYFRLGVSGKTSVEVVGKVKPKWGEETHKQLWSRGWILLGERTSTKFLQKNEQKCWN